MKNDQIAKERSHYERKSAGKAAKLTPKGQITQTKHEIRPVSLNPMEKENFQTDQAYLRNDQLEFLEMKNEIRNPVNTTAGTRITQVEKM